MNPGLRLPLSILFMCSALLWTATGGADTRVVIGTPGHLASPYGTHRSHRHVQMLGPATGFGYRQHRQKRSGVVIQSRRGVRRGHFRRGHRRHGHRLQRFGPGAHVVPNAPSVRGHGTHRGRHKHRRRHPPRFRSHGYRQRHGSQRAIEPAQRAINPAGRARDR